MAADLFPFWSFYAIPWLLGLGTAVAARVLGHRPLQAAGVGLMSVPLWDTFWGILDSLGPLVQGGQVLLPYTRHQLSSLYEGKFLSELGYMAAGFLLYASASWRDVWHQTPRRLARALQFVGLPLGRLPAWWDSWQARRGIAPRTRPWTEARSLRAGVLLFPLLLVVTIGLDSLLSSVKSLNQSDEASVFANMTPYHALMISLAAGFGEELAYRGILQTFLSRRLPMWLAVVAQAVFFGFAHSGYGTWSHVLLPIGFGLVAGAAAWAFGLWAGIALHTLVDLFSFGADVARHHAWAGVALSDFLLADAALSLVVPIVWMMRWQLRSNRNRVPPTV